MHGKERLGKPCLARASCLIAPVSGLLSTAALMDVHETDQTNLTLKCKMNPTERAIDQTAEVSPTRVEPLLSAPHVCGTGCGLASTLLAGTASWLSP